MEKHRIATEIEKYITSLVFLHFDPEINLIPVTGTINELKHNYMGLNMNRTLI